MDVQPGIKIFRRFVWAAGVVLLLAACGDGGDGTPVGPPSPGGTTFAVSIVAFATNQGASAYNPNPLTIARGDRVIWTNNDSTTHTVTSDLPSAELGSGNIAAGTTYSYTFNTAGTFNYHCDVGGHNMTGTVVVQ
jgi:plastocyanin